MRFQRSRLRWPEIVAGVAAVVLLLSMFLLPWYGYKGDLAPLAARLGVSTSGAYIGLLASIVISGAGYRSLREEGIAPQDAPTDIPTVHLDPAEVGTPS